MTLSGENAQLMSMKEIAELAGVQRPVVTNWRRRYDTFPSPVAGDQTQPLFDGAAIARWLLESGRAKGRDIQGDLHIYTLARLGTRMPPRTLVATLTALICLRHLTGGELLDDGTPGLITRLRQSAHEVDPDDHLLLSEITALRAVWLPRAADDLVEAAWSEQGAFERVMQIRDRLGAAELSVDRLDPALLQLAAGLADAAGQADRSGTARIADSNAGPADLLLAVADSLREDQHVHLAAGCSDPYLARLTRRRLTVRDLNDGDFEVRANPAETLETANVIVTQQPYRPGEVRTATETLEALNDVSLRLAAGTTAVVVAPTDATAQLDPASPAGALRAELLSSGSVQAIIRLPGGLVPYRPGYEVALWVLNIDYRSPLRGRVLLADVSDRELTPAVTDALTTDVLTWRRQGFDPNAHSRAYAVATPVAVLAKSMRPLTPCYLPTERELQGISERVARALELERVLRDVRPEQRMLHSDLAIRANPVPPRTATIADLVHDGRARTNRLSLRKGTRIAADLIGSDRGNRASSYGVLGPSEVLGRSAMGSRRVDRVAFETTYRNSQRSLPGDVVITTTPEPAATVDHDGYSVVEFPARILRITERGTEHFTPRVLAALLTLSGRAERAIRPVQRLEELRLPLLATDELTRFDQLLAELEVRQRLASDETAAIHELHRIAATGLADGTLTFADYQK